MKRVLRFCLSLGAGLLMSIAIAQADELHLKDGRVIEAEEVWEVGDVVWYRQGKIIASFAKSDVIRITKPKPERTANPASNLPVTESRILTPVAGPTGNSSGNEIISRKISRIILKGGTQIDADAVWPTDWEDSDRIGY